MPKGLKTEHAGAKNGGGGYGKRTEVKHVSRRARRATDREAGRGAGAPKATRGRTYTFEFTPDEGNTWTVVPGRSIAQARKRLRDSARHRAGR
jgi:hypothetical protein